MFLGYLAPCQNPSRPPAQALFQKCVPAWGFVRAARCVSALKQFGGLAHVFVALEGLVEDERFVGMAVGVRFAAAFHVGVQDVLVLWINAVVYDGDGAPAGVFAAQVGDAVLGGDHLDGVFAVVEVADKGDDGADGSAFLNRGTGENGQVGVAREVARAADAVHQAGAHDMRGVHVAEDVHLDGRVHRDDAQAAHHLGTVGDFLRAEDELVAVGVPVGVNALDDGWGDGERGAAGEGDAALLKELDDAVLDDLGIQVEGGEVLVLRHGFDDGVGDVADAGLEGEPVGQPPCFALGGKEPGDVGADGARDFRGLVKAPHFVLRVVEHDAGNARGINAHDGVADAASCVEKGDFAPGGWIGRLVNVMKPAQEGGLSGVELEDDFAGNARKGVGDADGGGEHDASVRTDVTHFDDGPVHLAEESRAQPRLDLREVHVEIDRAPGVDAFAQRVVGLVGGAPRDGVRSGKCAVERGARGGAGDDADAPGFALGMEGGGAPGHGGRDNLGGAGGGESAEAHGGAVVDERGGFLGSDYWEGKLGHVSLCGW